MLRVNLSDIAIITVKGVDYHCIIHDISKYDTIHLLKNSVLDDREEISKKPILKVESSTVILTI